MKQNKTNVTPEKKNTIMASANQTPGGYMFAPLVASLPYGAVGLVFMGVPPCPKQIALFFWFYFCRQVLNAQIVHAQANLLATLPG